MNQERCLGTITFLGDHELLRVARDAVAVIPAVSVGNVGQLSVDLFIHRWGGRLVGRLLSDSVLPFAAAREDSIASEVASLTLAVEIYRIEHPPGLVEQNLIVVQQRAPTCRGQAARWASELVEWLGSVGVKRIVLLSSASKMGGRDSQLKDEFAGHFRVMMTEHMEREPGVRSLLLDTLRWRVVEGTGRLGWVPSETTGSEETTDASENFESMRPAFLPAMRPGSFIRVFLQTATLLSIPTLGLVRFVHEGDNAADALELASCLESWIRVSSGSDAGTTIGATANHSFPPSWRHLFGDTEANETLY